MSEPVKRCRQCGAVKQLTEFRRNSTNTRRSYVYDIQDPRGYRPRCAICEITTITEAKIDDPYRHKARDTRRHHARRFGIPLKELDEHYGWGIDVIAADIQKTFETVCQKCKQNTVRGRRWVLSEVHIGIEDPTHPPFYGANTRVVCQTCNLRQQRKSSVQMACEEAELQAIARRAHPQPGQLGFDW